MAIATLTRGFRPERRFAGRVAKPVSIKAMNDAVAQTAAARLGKSGR